MSRISLFLWAPAGLLRAAMVLCIAGLLSVTTSADESSDFYENALARFEKGEYAAAIIQLKNALQENPDDSAARLLMGRAYLRVGNGAAAEIELRKARLRGSHEDLVVVPLARAYLLQGKYDALFDEVRGTTSVAPEIEGELMVIRGEAHLERGELDEAERSFAQASRLLPDTAGPVVGRARVMLARGRYDEANRLAAAAGELDPQEPDVWYVRGEGRRLTGDLSGAIEGYARVLEVAPNHVAARIGRAAALIDLDREKDAIADLLIVRRMDPENLQAAYLHALALARSGDMKAAQVVLDQAKLAIVSRRSDFIMNHPPSLLVAGVVSYARREYDEAFRYLNRYVKLAPRHPGSRQLLGALYLRKGEPGRAVDVLRPALALAPNDPQIMAALATAYMRLGKTSEASQLYEQAAELMPDAASIRTQLALSRLAAGDREAALTDLESARALDPEATYVSVLLGLAYIRQGDFEQSLRVADALSAREPQNPFAHSLAGAARFRMGDVAGARASFERALASDPDYQAARFNLAKIDLVEGDSAAAKQKLRKILDTDRGHTEAMLELAAIASREGRPKEAIQWLEKLRRVAPEDTAALYRLIDLYIADARPARALQLAREQENRTPADPRVVDAIGRSQLAAGKREQAVATFRRLAAKSRQSVRWSYRAGHLQLRAGDVDGAGETFTTAIELDPTYLPAHAALVDIEVTRGNYEAALARARKVRDAHPESGVGNELIGDVLMRAGRPAEAVAAYASALEKEQTSALNIRLFRARRAAGDTEAALPALEAWVAEHPEDVAARRVLAAGYIDAGRLARAMEAHEALLQTLPDDAALLNNLAWLYLRSDDQRALPYAKKAHALAPDEPALLDTLGWILVQEGEAAQGLKYLRQAQNRLGNDSRVAYHVAVALDRLGRSDAARRELEQALKAGEDFEDAGEARALLRRLSGG